ncbi:uncharacterized protein MKK02DRAFT_38484 [Dioszegia hungarica]|uniref:Uncharacterized protein n=1 Tax=Dioszegia hungarica TaxID=4972 RepID=A0AA38LSW3_9TREE|nr:uncharacterized protein MKK02DRAFT_38484 [Dioszegia hungarica]KAI9633823.1 hypothetical protein MKK02DRAFT_38484 [Dioszegia hungarica]
MALQTESILPFTLRLNALEAKVIGASSYPSSDPRDTAPPKLGESSKTALRRVREIHEALERIGGDNEGLRRFIGNYEAYLPFLSLPDPSSASGAQGDPSDPSRPATGPIAEYDLVPDKVKVTMLLEAAADIKGVERDLREVELLKGRGVEGAGELEKLLPLRPQLLDRTRESQNQSQALSAARQQTTNLLVQYNEYTSALSELFLDIHRRLEYMEEAVSRVERKKRRELAERY